MQHHLACYPVLPAIIEANSKTGQTRLRIWSAGCSTGEEPFTLSILAAKYPALPPFDLARFTFEMECMLDEVHAMVERTYGARR